MRTSTADDIHEQLKFKRYGVCFDSRIILADNSKETLLNLISKI
ncbi:hypothetical protein [Methanobrevibacter sp. TMH8]|nr:hypothetical protein [Methanobrevibacter sp. TMH8]